MGWSTEKFCTLGLPVDSIEIEQNIYSKVKEKLKYENLKLHLGNSVDVLNEIIKQNEENILLFLDSHWYELPILKELEVIFFKKIKPVILIHDFFVPDENGNSKFGFDTYDGVKLDFNLIKDYIEKIYDNEYDFHYTSEIDCVNSGIIFIYPKFRKDGKN